MVRLILTGVLAIAFQLTPAMAQSKKEMRADINQLLLDIQSIKSEMIVVKNVAQLRSLQSGLLVKMGEVEKQLRGLTGQIERLEFKQRNLENDFALLKKEMDVRFDEMRASGAATDGAVAQPRAQVPSQQTPVQKPTKTATGSLLSGAGEKEEFDSAFAYVRAGELAKGEKAMLEFEGKYPKSSFTPNVKFWLGRVYLMQKENAKAAKQFLAVVTNHADSDKATAALIDLSDALIKLDEKAEACRTLAEYRRVNPNPSQRESNRQQRLSGLAGCQ